LTHIPKLLLRSRLYDGGFVVNIYNDIHSMNKKKKVLDRNQQFSIQQKKKEKTS
jgi:hypothetical protein